MSSLFKRKKVPEDRPSQEQIFYQAAYSLFPYYLFQDEVGGNRNLFLMRPRVAGIQFLVGVCFLNEFEPSEELAKRFGEAKGYSGTLAEGVEYRIFEYPRPAAIDISALNELEDLPPDQLLKKLATIVPAPYFSILLLSEELLITEYLVLGQSPDGGTSLRQVTEEANANLGPGCEPELEALLDFLRDREANKEEV